jgi:Trypsin-like peptidase domain
LRSLIVSLSLLIGHLTYSQVVPLTQRQACDRFSDAIVSIDAGGNSQGSGFLVSASGFILTASHIVRDEDGAPYAVIEITLWDKRKVFAKLASPMTWESVGQDFALLKIDTTKPLPFLERGSVSDANIGGDATIIGFPFSAISHKGDYVNSKFCLSASFAAVGTETVPVNGTIITAKGRSPVNKDVKVDVIYFQGPSVKGISGSPIITRDNGKVVGIVSTKLTGIDRNLDIQRKKIIEGSQYGKMTVLGVDPNAVLSEIIDTLDRQLANGLGSATGVDDPKEVLRKVQRTQK